MKRPSKYTTQGKRRDDVVHATSTIDPQEYFEHIEHIPLAERTDASMKFERWYFKDAKEANRVLGAFTSGGGFGSVVGNSIRACAYWASLVNSLLPGFAAGSPPPVEPNNEFTQKNTSTSLALVDEIPPSRKQDQDIAATCLRVVGSQIGQERFASGPAVMPIVVPWPSTEIRTELPQTNVEMSFDRKDAMRVQGALAGFCEDSDLKPWTILFTVSYSDGKTFGGMITLKPGQ